jgi:alkylhydroperoxidase family enzyme
MTNTTRAATVLLLLIITGQSRSRAQLVRPPRIMPVESVEWTDEQKAVLGPRAAQSGQAVNAQKICLHNADLCKNWLSFSNYIEGRTNSLAAREKEMLILRTAWLCRDNYVWSPHAANGIRGGLTPEDVDRIPKGPDAPGWNVFDAALLRAADELHKDQLVTDATWKTLTSRYSDKQMLDVLFTVGDYTMVAMYLNSVGAPLEPGWTPLPK